MYDVVIIGAGPSGISASLYLKRANLNVLVISKGSSSLEKAEKIENYYGLEKSVSGKELFEIGIKQAKKLGIEVVQDEVINISKQDEFVVTTVNRQYQAKKVILATGVSRKRVDIKGIKEYEGRGVSYCAICDGFFYKNKDVAVIGSGNYAICEAKNLKPIVRSVIILTNGEQIVENRDDAEFEVESSPIKEVRGGSVLEEIEFKNNSTKKVNGVFVAVGTASSSDLARKIGAVLDKNQNIKVDENMKTTVEGLYACGDCTGGLLQINKAVYEGAKAALDIINNK